MFNLFGRRKQNTGNKECTQNEINQNINKRDYFSKWLSQVNPSSKDSLVRFRDDGIIQQSAINIISNIYRELPVSRMAQQLVACYLGYISNVCSDSGSGLPAQINSFIAQTYDLKLNVVCCAIISQEKKKIIMGNIDYIINNLTNLVALLNTEQPHSTCSI